MSDSEISNNVPPHTTPRHNAAVPVHPHNHPISFKLSDSNYLIWRQQIMTTVRGYGLESFLIRDQQISEQHITVEGSTETTVNPEFLLWTRQDQLLSAWIQSSLTESTMVQIVGLTSSKEIWQTIEANFGSQSKAKVLQYKLQLQTLKKDALSMRDYLDKVKMCCDLLGSAGCRVLDEDQILHILAGLGKEYDPVVVTITSKADSWSVQDMSTLLLSFESRLESTNNSSINLDGSQPSAHIAQTTSQRRENFSNHHRGGFAGYRRIEGGRGTGYRGGRGGRGRFSSNRPNCQLCQKPGHTADKCWYRFEQNFTPQNPHQQQLQQPSHGQDQPSIFGRHPTANMAQARSNNSQSHHFPSEFSFDGSSSSSWYPDSRATNHISNDLSNLNISSEYQGGMKLQLGNGKGIDIVHIGHSFLNASPSPNSRSLLLNHLLHVPQITKNLLSVSQFARDNSVFFEFHPSACFVKDQVTKETLLKGTLSHGLYKFCLHKPSSAHPSFPSFSKKTPSPSQACSVALLGHAPAANSHSTPSLELWHNRLGHCAFDIVKKGPN